MALAFGSGAIFVGGKRRQPPGARSPRRKNIHRVEIVDGAGVAWKHIERRPLRLRSGREQFMQGLLQDIRYSLRQFMNNPEFTLTALR